MYPKPRRQDSRFLKRKVVVSVEGAVTEDEYFKRIGKLYWDKVVVDIPKNVNKSAPNHVLDRIRNYRGKLNPGDEMWCVIDSDKWTPKQKADIAKWATEKSGKVRRYFGMSNPKIELWLTLHFVDWDPNKPGFLSALRKHMPTYDKHIEQKRITKDNVLIAIGRGKKYSPSPNPPLKSKGSNLWVLVEHIARQ